MASIVPHGKRWRAHVHVNNHRHSKVCRTKGEARAWIEAAEKRLSGRTSPTLAEAFERYGESVSPTKRGCDWELARLEKFTAYFAEHCSPALAITDVDQTHIAAWRDWRMKSVQAGTVLRELTLLSSVFTVAWSEWRWCKDNPCKGVRRPSAPPPRDQVYTQDEVGRICAAMGCSEEGQLPTTTSHRVALAFLFALETAMRCGEICAIRPGHLKGNVLRVPDSKNGFPRDVPMSKKALAYLELVEGSFDLIPSQVDSLFRKYKKRAGVNLTFHDSRHTAITRLAQVLNPLELARMVGHKNVNQLMTYYNESASNLAARLDAAD